MQNKSNEKNAKSNTSEGLKDYSSISLRTPPEKGEQLVSKMPGIEEVFDSMGGSTINLSTENNLSKKEVPTMIIG